MQEVEVSRAEDTIILYFHSKGMVNNEDLKRPFVEAEIFNGTIALWHEVLNIFRENATVSRVGMYPSHMGWVWFHFWWACTSYLKKVVEPIRTSRRYFYEDWLGRLYDPTTNDNAEPGRFEDCSSCYSVTGKCSGHGIMYNPDTMHNC